MFTQDPDASLGRLPLSHIELLFDVWADRYRELGSRDHVQYVFPFENRGVEVGVTLHHPHGQIYAYPFVPPVAARELAAQQAYYEEHGRGLLDAIVDAERHDGRRILFDARGRDRVHAGVRTLCLRGVDRAASAVPLAGRASTRPPAKGLRARSRPRC